MTDMTLLPIEQNFKTTISQALAADAAALTVNINTAPTATIPAGFKFIATLEPETTREENVLVESLDASAKTFTISAGGRAQDLGNGKSGTLYEHPVGSAIIISDAYPQYNDIKTAMATKMDKSGGTFTGAVDFTNNDSTVTFRVPNVTTAERDAIASPQNGMDIYNTSDGTRQTYDGGVWVDIDTGAASVSNASETVAGIIELATVAEQGTATSTGDTGARLVMANSNLVKTSSGAGDENKVAVLDATGKYATGFIDYTPATDLLKFGGTGADGAQGDANLTITGSNDTYIEKNFTTWAAGSVARTLTVTPTGCVTYIKIQGDADFTNWDLDFAGKGMPGGAGGAKNAAGVASSFPTNFFGLANRQAVVPGAGANEGAASDNGGGGGGGAASMNEDGTAGTAGLGGGGAAGAKGEKSTNDFNIEYTQLNRIIVAGIGMGGSGGGGSDDASNGAVGGAGGDGGGLVIFEIGGNVTFSTTAASVAGTAAVVGGDASGANNGGGGGGGAPSGGFFLMLYNGTLTGSLVPTVTAGAAGLGGNGTGTGDDGSPGGAGGDGDFLIEKNVKFT